MTDLVIEQTVLIERPVSAVFKAWSSGPQMAAWFAPMAVRTDVDMRFQVGGSYRIGMDLGPGGLHVTEGRFLEIVPDERIKFTWRCDAWNDPPSEVEVRFAPQGTATVLTVRHSRVSSAAAQEGQRFGWEACLAQLRLFVLDPA